MKKILSMCALALFLGASIVGCGSSTTTPPASTNTGGGSGKPKTDMAPKADMPPKADAK